VRRENITRRTNATGKQSSRYQLPCVIGLIEAANGTADSI